MEDKIFDLILKDLSGFSQNNPAPSQLTIKDSNGFRHYELGDCFGVVCFNEGYIFFCDIKESDGNWFCFEETDRNYSDANWIKTKIHIYSKMLKWLNKNANRGYYSGFKDVTSMECGFTNLKK